MDGGLRRAIYSSMILRRIFYLLALTIVLFPSVSCKTAGGPEFDPLLSYAGTDTLMFIYNPTSPFAVGGGVTFNINIDGKKVVALKSTSYTRVFLKQGGHILRITRFHVEKAKREYVHKFTISADTARLYLRVSFPDPHLILHLTEVAINTQHSNFPTSGESNPAPAFNVDFMDGKFLPEDIHLCKFRSPKINVL